MEEDKNIEKFTKDILNEIGLEKPSSLFVNNVMNLVEEPLEEKITLYQPLISKKAWFFIVACFIGIITYAFTLPYEASLFDKIGINLSTDINFNFLQGLSFSSPAVYALSTFGILVFIQIYLLKDNFNKQIGAL